MAVAQKQPMAFSLFSRTQSAARARAIDATMGKRGKHHGREKGEKNQGGKHCNACGKAMPLSELLAWVSKPRGDGEEPLVATWQGNEECIFVIFASQAAQRSAMARLSLYLEDSLHAGTIAPRVPPERPARNYTGHNMRLSDLERFAEAAGTLTPEEEALVNLVRRSRSDSTKCVLTVARGLGQAESRSALRHEAMHGAFYTSGQYQDAAWDFWRSRMSHRERNDWASLVGSLGYNADSEELLVNEFQAYMATESLRGKWRDHLADAQRRFLSHLQPVREFLG